MNKDQIISTLAQYKEKLSAILDRFSKTRDRIHIDIQDGYRFREIVIELVDFINDHIPNSKHHSTMIANYYNEGISNWLGSSSYASVEQVKGVVNAVITRIERNPSLFESASGEITVDDVEEKRSGGIETITSRFHSVVMQMRHRYKNRPTLDVHDEYDVQDFFHSLLKLYFNDIRPEEWAPSYAGGSSRTDFLLPPEILTFVEVKKTRPTMSTRELGEQLIIDVAKYKKHPQCKRLICFVYDPDGRLSNPRGIESDMSNCDSDIDVRTIIVQKHT